MEHKGNPPHSSVINENVVEKPLSPILNKKRFSRKSFLDRKISKKQLSECAEINVSSNRRLSSIPVPIRENFDVKRVQVDNVDKDDRDVKCTEFETASGNSISEGTICEYTNLFADILNVNVKTESDPKMKRDKKFCLQQPILLQNVEYMNASGDISEESDIVEIRERQQFINGDGTEDHLSMLYENQKFITTQTSKTTAIGSAEDVESVDGKCELVNKSQLDYNVRTDDSNSTLEQEIKELERVFVKGFKKEEEVEVEERVEVPEKLEGEYVIGTQETNMFFSNVTQLIDEGLQHNSSGKDIDLPDEVNISKNLVNVNVTQSFFSSNHVLRETDPSKDEKTHEEIKLEDFYGFAEDEIKKSEKQYMKYKTILMNYDSDMNNVIEAIKKKIKKSTDLQSCSSEIPMSSKKLKHNLNEPPLSNPGNNSEHPKKRLRHNSTELSTLQSSQYPNSISVPSNNRVQICIGNNRIKINIKTPQGDTKINLNDDIKPDLNPVVGFKSAAGKPIQISENLLKNAEKLYESTVFEVPQLVKPKNVREQQKPSKNKHVHKGNRTPFTFTASGKPIRIQTKNVERLYGETLEGASNRPHKEAAEVHIDANAACALRNDGDKEDTSAKTNTLELKSNSKKPTHIEENNAERFFEEKLSTFTGNCSGFKTVSGKPIYMQENVLKNAERFFKEKLFDLKPNNGSADASGSKSSSGKHGKNQTLHSYTGKYKEKKAAISSSANVSRYNSVSTISVTKIANLSPENKQTPIKINEKHLRNAKKLYEESEDDLYNPRQNEPTYEKIGNKRAMFNVHSGKCRQSTEISEGEELTKHNFSNDHKLINEEFRENKVIKNSEQNAEELAKDKISSGKYGQIDETEIAAQFDSEKQPDEDQAKHKVESENTREAINEMSFREHEEERKLKQQNTDKSMNETQSQYYSNSGKCDNNENCNLGESRHNTEKSSQENGDLYIFNFNESRQNQAGFNKPKHPEESFKTAENHSSNSGKSSKAIEDNYYNSSNTARSFKADKFHSESNENFFGKCQGFQMVSGKTIKISEKFMRQAEKIFAETDENSDGPTQNTQVYNYNNESREISDKNIIEKSSAYNFNLGKTPETISCFKSAAGKEVNISKHNLQDAERVFQNLPERKILKPKSLLKPRPECGRPSYLQGSGSRKSLQFLDGWKRQSCSSLGDPGKNIVEFESFKGSKFSFISGVNSERSIEQPKESVSNIMTINDRIIENDLNNTESGNSKNTENTESVDCNNQQIEDSIIDTNKQHDLCLDDKTIPEIIQDVVNTYDSAIEKISSPLKIQHSKNTPDRKPYTIKKQLGMLGYHRPINISREGFEKGKQIFDDILCNNANNTNFSTPVKNTQCSKLTSFPNMSTPKVQKFIPAEFNITPIKAPTIVKKLDSDSTIIFHEKSCSDFTQLQNGINIECLNLKKKLSVLEERKSGLEEQKALIDGGSEDHRRQKTGILLRYKDECKQRVPLKHLFNSGDESVDYFNVDQHIFDITPKNAEDVHFNISSTIDCISVIRTKDGATVIPSSSNTVGLTEINNAFHAMSGVDPKLLPRGWVQNHYKWIVWKLASYERKFPQYFKECLSLENLIQQLKYRYDVEIDRAKRSALRMILEKDDVPQKRMVLCISNIIQIYNNKFELELSDGWYSVKTVIDPPLCQQIYKGKIKVGTKLIIQGAELLNCEDGTHPLEAIDIIRLKIGYNGTRRAHWYTKLGYYKYPSPFPIHMSSLHPEGGPVGFLKIYIARVYPVRYIENHNSMKIWRNGKAEEKRANEFDAERMKQIENIRFKALQEYEKEKHDIGIRIENKNITKNELANITCPKILYNLVQCSSDPESLIELLTQSQQRSIVQYKENMNDQRRHEITIKISKQINELEGNSRNVVPVLKLLVIDACETSTKSYVFNIWRPTEDHLQLLKEESSFCVYNVTIRNRGELNSNNRTYFRLNNAPVSFKKVQRQLLPIAMTADNYYKPLFNEFDTVGLIVQISITNYDQELWLADFIGRLLYIRIVDGPKICCLLDNLKRGQTVAISNLIKNCVQNDFGIAVANQCSIISQYPSQKYLQHGLQIFNQQLPMDVNKLLMESDCKIDQLKKEVDFRNIHSLRSTSLLKHHSYVNDHGDDSLEDNSTIPSRLTMTDVAMSLIDTDQFT